MIRADTSKIKVACGKIKDFVKLLNSVHCDKCRRWYKWEYIILQCKKYNLYIDITSLAQLCNSDEDEILKNKLNILDCRIIHSH